MRDLIVYPNASKGGVSTVIRGRAVAEPQRGIDAVFFADKGGANAFEDLPLVRTLIVSPDRRDAVLKYMAGTFDYASASVLSAPAVVAQLAGRVRHLRYEFHSSDLTIIKNEIDKLDTASLDEISVPTRYMAQHVRALLPISARRKLNVLPNLVDHGTFRPEGAAVFAEESDQVLHQGIPLIWVGRFDKGKGHRHFARMLAGLPREYVGIMVVSLEKDPDRVSQFLAECAVMGVLDRVRVYLNLPQKELAALYRWARDRGGSAVSTSLLESFGYFVAEATACALPVVAFDLPVWAEHDRRQLITTVPTGSVRDLVSALAAPGLS